MINKDRLINFLRENFIEYRDYGPNVSSNNVNIRCPLCKNDPSFHMGINYNTGVFGCWRDPLHKGKNVAYLLSKVTKLPVSKIVRDLGLVTTLAKDDMAKALEIVSGDNKQVYTEPRQNKTLTFKKSFIPLFDSDINFRYIKPAIDYLQARGFSRVVDMAKYYSLHYDYYGEWKYRIIFPIYYKNKLVTWVGRSINNNLKPKYKDLSKEESVIHCKDCLFDYDNLTKGGEVLCITEGVIDAAKVNMPNKGIRATCLFTKKATEQQLDLLYSLKGLFDKVLIVLDNDALSDAISLSEKLKPYIDACVVVMDDAYEDPGSIPQHLVYKEIQKWMQDGI